LNLFHGWRIVGASALIQFLYAGLLMQAFGAYVAVLAEDRGWSKTALAGGAALQSLEGAVIGPVMGWMVDRWGARRIVQAGLVILGLGFMVLSRIETLGGFYVAIVLMAIGGSLCGYFPLTITVMHWFRRQRARALSTMGLGLSLGGLAVPLVAASMQAYGWRTTAFGSGVLLIVLGWPLAALLRRDPSEVGETVDGLPPETPAVAGPAAPAAPAERSFTALEAVRTQAFWLLGLGHGCALLVVTAVNVHAISHMKEGLGYTVTEASLVITLMTVAQTAGMVLGALVGDRWNKAHIAAACMLMHMAGLLLLTFAVNPLMLGAFAVVHGLAWGLRGPLMQAMRADYFGLQAIGMIMGLSAFIISLGQVAGPMVAGGFADATGNYRWGFAVLAVISGAGSLLFVFAKKPT
jgi:MFS family permease